LHDEDEDEYVHNLTNWEKDNSPEKSLPGKTINLQLTKYFTVEKSPASFVASSTHLCTDAKAASDSFLYTSPLKNILTPPPDHLVS